MANTEKEMDGIKELGNHLIELWGKEIRHKRMSEFIDKPLQKGEVPEEMAPAGKLVLVNEYFENNDIGFRFPKLLKQFKAEDDVQYESRVKNYLLCMSEEQFSLSANLVDPDDVRQQTFIELYNEVQSQRGQQAQKTEKKKEVCTIF